LKLFHMTPETGEHLVPLIAPSLQSNGTLCVE
jgi:hypothetical protein